MPFSFFINVFAVEKIHQSAAFATAKRLQKSFLLRLFLYVQKVALPFHNNVSAFFKKVAAHGFCNVFCCLPFATAKRLQKSAVFVFVTSFLPFKILPTRFRQTCGTKFFNAHCSTNTLGAKKIHREFRWIFCLCC